MEGLKKPEEKTTKCPKCSNEMSLNRRSFWECCNCHVQFTTNPTFHQVTPDDGIWLRFSDGSESPALELKEIGKNEF